MKKTFKVTFKGSDGGAFNYVDLKLSGTQVPLGSNDGDVTWVNGGIDIIYNSPLHINLECGALRGTTWDITVQDTSATDPCYKDSGVTGDKPGGAKPNISVRDVDSKC